MNIFGFGYFEAGWLGHNQFQHRFGKWWIWVGPYVIGYVRNF